MGPADAAWRAGVRAALAGPLGLQHASDLQDGLRAVRAEGARLFERSHAASPDPSRRRQWQRGAMELGMSIDALHRIVGFGAQQARALLRAAGEEPVDERGIETAAWFNLAIVLFDALLDGRGGGAEAIARLDSALLAAWAEAPHNPFVHHMHSGAAFFGSVAEDVLRGVTFAPARGEVLDALHGLLAAETGLARSGRGTAPTLAVWRAMRRKSAEPLRVAALAATRLPSGSVQRARLLRVAGRFGELLWIVDDLVDAPDDWRAGTWSRGWWWLARQSDERMPADAAHALDRLAGSGWAASEAHRMACHLHMLGAEAADRGALQDCARLTVTAWL